jgi:coproporphyrinogen dehydrogenase HemZ
MLCVIAKEQDFKYEIQDIVKLFYRDEDVTWADSEVGMTTCEVLLTGCLQEENGQLFFSIALRADKKEVYAATISISFDLQDASRYEDRKRLKKEIKRSTYLALACWTGRDMPWGVLTGIRPAKLVHELWDQGMDREQVKELLCSHYLLSEKKADLLYRVAAAERSLLKRSTPDTVSLYVGIPFCTTRCLYCSFTSNSIDKYAKFVQPYLEALYKEMQGVAGLIREQGWRIQSVYIGGGTPTALDATSLKRLLWELEKTFSLGGIEEFTLEAGRPDTIDEEKLAVIRDSRVDRISINPQTMNNETLQLIGRNHTAEDVENAFALARRMGFSNINMDLIAGLPGENCDLFAKTLERVRVLGPENLTVHTMAVKRASKLNEDRHLYELAAGEEASKMVDMAHEAACDMGLKPYYLYRQKNILGNLENIGYSKPGLESIYNIQIMEEKQTILAVGAGAITKAVFHDENRIERAINVKSLEDYMTRVDEMIERKNILFIKQP